MNKNSDNRTAAYTTLLVLFLINTLNFFDRMLIGALGEPIRKEFELSDSSLGLLSTAFVLIYAAFGIPLGRLADTISRKKILAASVFFWSLFTFATGFAKNVYQVFLLRFGVGIGEAGCAPAATSMISDLFPPERRSRAMSIFMLGLPIGIGSSFYLSGMIAQSYGWRYVFIAAGIPGFVLAVAALLLREPRRESVPSANTGIFSYSSYSEVIGSKVVLWLIVSGIMHNFTMYALSSFMTPYLMRFHKLPIAEANTLAMLVNGVFTLPGLLLGGLAGDYARRWRVEGGLLIAAIAILVSAPLLLMAVLVDAGSTGLFLIAMGSGFALMYFYYSVTYSAISEAVPADKRGTAMAVYFLAMYLLGGAFGPYVLGAVSDHFTRQAANYVGIAEFTVETLEPFRAAGLRSAMYLAPVLCILLAAVMFMAARSFKKFSERRSVAD